MFRKVLLLLLAASTLAATPPPAQMAVPMERVVQLDLPLAIQFALAKNFSIEGERLNPQIAKQRERQAYGKFDPNFDVSLVRAEDTLRSQFRRDGETNKGGHFSINDITQSGKWSAGISGVTPLGTAYDVGAGSLNRSGTFNRFENDLTSDVTLSVSQPLLRGAGKTVQLAGIRIARNNVTISEWSLREQTISVITGVINVYNELNFARENLAVAKRSRALADRLLQDNIKRVQIGVMKPLDVTTAQAEVASRAVAVITADRAVKDNENFLKQLISDDMLPLLGTRVRIASPQPPSFHADVLAGVGEALEFRPDYQQAKLGLANRHIALAFEKNQRLPRLDLTGSLHLLGFDDDFATSVSRAATRDQTNWTAGAIFSIPLGNTEGRARYDAAKLESAQAIVRLKQLEQNIIVLVDNASGAVVTANQRIAATREAHRLALESLDAGQQRLVAGAGTVFEVLELQKKLAEAETSELRARADYHEAIANYQQQTGTALRFHAVKIE